MARKRHVALTIVAVWLVLDVAADLARTVACSAPTDPATLAACESQDATGETLAEKVRRLLLMLDEPAGPPPPPTPPPPVPSPPESQLDRLRRGPGL